MNCNLWQKLNWTNFNLEWKLCSMTTPTYLYKVIVYKSRGELFLIKVYIFCEGHNILRNLHRTFVLCASQFYIEDFEKFCGLIRIYELYKKVRFGLVLGLLAGQCRILEFLVPYFQIKLRFPGKTSKIWWNLCFWKNSRYSWKASKIWRNLQPSFDIT